MVFVFTYVNGFHDGCNVVATLIASRSMKPYPALAWAAVVEVLSPFAMLVVGSSVSDTIKKLVGGVLILKLILLLTGQACEGINKFITYAPWFNMTFLAFNHSFNDSQKSIGIVMILLGIYGGNVDSIPVWAIACAALCLSCGIAFGGFKIIKTVGTGIYKVQPIHSFASQLTAGAVILSASMLGAPVSASQIVSSSIMGVGSAERYKAVHWNVAGKILTSWFITIPIAGTLGAILYFVFAMIF